MAPPIMQTMPTGRVAEIHASAMGTDVTVIVVDGGADLPSHAIDRIQQLEQRWSRFLPDSEISRLNACAGRPRRVSDETFGLISTAVDAWELTAGRFDPSILPALIDLGYDRSFELLGEDEPTGIASSTTAAPGCDGILLDPAQNVVILPQGLAFDPGGIGKGLAADLVAAELLAAGARGACVNLGGDLRVTGAGPADEGWVIAIVDPFDERHDLETVVIGEGAVATSSRLRRRWGPAHHLIDPRTGGSASSGLAAVTVIAANAVTADIVAKAAFVAGPDAGPGVVTQFETAALLFTDDGACIQAGPVEEFLS